MTSWVPLAESGIDHALYVEPPFESSITLDGSTIVADNATRVSNFGIGWDLDISVADVPEYFTGRVRVATQIDYVDAPEAGPLVFYYSEEGGADPAIVNEHEDSTAFVPDPVVLGPLAPWSGPGSDGLVQFTAWGIDVLSATFYIEVEVQDDGPPSGECFWTDLLGVTEDCGEAPEPNDGFVDFWLNEHNGYGSAYGQVAIYHIEGGEQSQYVCNSALYEALLTAESVRITGLAVMQNPPTSDAPDGWDTCEVPLEDGIVWTDVDHEMSLRDTWGDGYNVMYYWYNNEPEGSHTWYNVRVDVDGQVFYGVVYIGGGV